MAIGWSRRETTTPLEYFSLCFQRSDAQWEVLKLHEGMYELDIAALEIPQLEPFKKIPDFFGLCVTVTATSVLDLNSKPGCQTTQPTLPLFGSYFRQLSVLRIHH
jgi:hypothetical protein